MQLYTVVLKNLHQVSRFDKKGKLLERIETEVEQIIRDLPKVTAQMYVSKDTRGTATMFAQDMTGFGDKHRHQVRFGDAKTGKSTRAEPVRTAAKPKLAAGSSAIQNAARSGDLAAAVSAGE